MINETTLPPGAIIRRAKRRIDVAARIGEDEFALADYTQTFGADDGEVATADRDPNNPATWGKVGRNEPCPCGSGKKYKKCHGA